MCTVEQEIFARSKFSIFAALKHNAKIRTVKYKWRKYEHVNVSVLVSLDLMMAMYRYFNPADDVLPSPTGHLLSSVILVMIKGMINRSR